MQRHTNGLILLLALLTFSCTQTKNAARSGYLFFVAMDTASFRVISTLKAIEEVAMSRSILGETHNGNETTLFITPETKYTATELSEKLKAIPRLQQVSVVALSNPIKASELADVRKLYNQNNYDLSVVSDDQLRLYLSTVLKNEWTYCLDASGGQDANGLNKLKFRLTKDILDEHRSGPPPKIISRKTTPDGGEVVVQDVVVQQIKEDKPPPPPQHAPKNLSKMTDDEIKRWYIKNSGGGVEDVKVKRTEKEIILSWKFKNITGEKHYPVK